MEYFNLRQIDKYLIYIKHNYSLYQILILNLTKIISRILTRYIESKQKLNGTISLVFQNKFSRGS